MGGKFVVFSHGRAGTNFLMNNLAAHPDTNVYMEPFHNKISDRSQVNGRKWKEGESSANFAYSEVFSDDSRVSGFKLFYFHCRQSVVSSDIWGALRDDADLKVIFLNRRNLLMKHLSDLRAQKSGVWHPTRENFSVSQYGDVVDVTVDIPALMRVMSDLYCGYHKVSEIFSNHQCFHMFFEDLAEDSDDIYGEVLDFLDLRSGEVVNKFKSGTLTKKTTRVTNGARVKEVVGSSIFSDFLETCTVL
ncbi:hypothetical protein [Aquicoccus sp. SU-CL01552]|uniref:hypothetical protein n=1 Tax=Aquicoccus sp. SU-CL01552 TaxID=3127656 RepID=UPI003107BCB1